MSDRPPTPELTLAPGLALRVVGAMRARASGSVVAMGAGLATNTALLSLVGFIFWAVAARALAPAELGLGSAALSAAILVANISSMGLTFAVIRYAAERRHSLGSLVNAMQTWVLLCVVAISGLLLGIHAAYPSALPLGGGSLPVWFVAGSVGWAVFAFGDSVLLACGRARLMVARNVVVAAARLLVVLLFAGALGASAMPASLLVGGVLGVLGLNLFLLPRLLPGHRARLSLRQKGARAIWGYALGSHFAALLAGSPALILPVIVVGRAGAEENALFTVAWLVATLVLSVPNALATSLFVQSSRGAVDLGRQVGRVLALSVAVAAGATLTLPLWGRWVLDLFGHPYGRGALSLTWVLVLSSLPAAVNVTFEAALRYLKEGRLLLLVSAVNAAGALVPAWLLLPRYGAMGAACGWLAGQSLTAAPLLVAALLGRGRLARRFLGAGVAGVR